MRRRSRSPLADSFQVSSYVSFSVSRLVFWPRRPFRRKQFAARQVARVPAAGVAVQSDPARLVGVDPWAPFRDPRHPRRPATRAHERLSLPIQRDEGQGLAGPILFDPTTSHRGSFPTRGAPQGLPPICGPQVGSARGAWAFSAPAPTRPSACDPAHTAKVPLLVADPGGGRYIQFLYGYPRKDP